MNVGNWQKNDERANKRTLRVPVQALIRPPQFPHALLWDRPGHFREAALTDRILRALPQEMTAATHKFSAISIAVNEATCGDTNYTINYKKF